MQLPAGRMAETFGGKWIIVGGIFLSGLINVLTRLFTDSVPLLVFSRIMLGFVQGGIFPAIYALLAKWLTQKEKSIAYGLTDCGSNMGTVLANLLTGYLSVHGFAGGWPSAFITCGAIAIVVSVVQAFFLKSCPEDHPLVSKRELAIIRAESTNDIGETVCVTPPVPWARILTSGPVLSAMFARLTVSIPYQVLQSKLPTYLHDILHVDANMVSCLYN